VHTNHNIFKQKTQKTLLRTIVGKKGSDSMTRILVPLVLVAILLPVSIFADTAPGCCANVFVYDQEYCKSAALTQDQCCPNTGDAYDSDSLYWPKTPALCKADFWKTTCDALDKCAPGCCYSAGLGEQSCTPAPKDACLDDRNGLGADEWIQGFDTPNPCYNEQGVAANPKCKSATHDDSCSDFRDSASCTAVQCFWCSGTVNKCLSACDSCTGKPADSNRDYVCDTQSSTECTARTARSDCMAASCNWCPTTNTCLKECKDCPNKPQDAAEPYKECDSALGQCSDGTDNEPDGRTDLEDFCCKDAADPVEDNLCDCEETGKGFCCKDYTQQCGDAGVRDRPRASV
jgi:hypothetical protein